MGEPVTQAKGERKKTKTSLREWQGPGRNAWLRRLSRAGGGTDEAGVEDPLAWFTTKSRTGASLSEWVQQRAWECKRPRYSAFFVGAEPPYAEPHVRWCGRTAGVIPPPTRSCRSNQHAGGSLL